ncbi:hypothetical protein C7E12_23160, partial [Stenotrophomonas maltophilia]
ALQQALRGQHVADLAGADAEGQRAECTVGGGVAKVLALRCSRHCVASTWPTSLVPMPKASEPNAPWVEVW